MKRVLKAGASLLALGVVSVAAAGGNDGVTALQKTATGIRLQTTQGTLVIEPWADRIVHVTAYRNADWKGAYNPAVIAKPQKVKWQLAEAADAYTLSTPALQVRVNRATAAISFRDPSGKVILDEPENARHTPVQGAGAVRQEFVEEFGKHHPVFGLGQHPMGVFNYRGNTVHLQQANRDVAVPMLVSQRGFGILWNNASVTDVDADVAWDPNQIVLRSEAGGGIDYDFIYGSTIDGVIAGYRQLTGDAPMMARWTWGLFQSKEHYATQQELLDVAAKYRELGAPLDAVVQDWFYWKPGEWGRHVMDPARYPDPAGTIAALHKENVHTILSVWPRFDKGLENAKELENIGGLFPKTSNVYPAGEGRWYDAYSPAARDLYWRQIMGTLGKAGWDGWRLDASEAELSGNWGEMRKLQTAAGPGDVVYNAYPLLHTTGVHDGMRRDIPNKRVFILTRSAYAGQQRNGAITWSGDTHGSWDDFRRQVPEALNFSLSGIPYWSADIGGFFSGDPKDPAYAELFTRWYQFGVFNPMFRVHGTSHPKEIWQFPAEIGKVLLDYDRLRYRLIPYIYALSWDVTHRGGTMMRPLIMDFQDDAYAALIGDEYTFGKGLLVAPVIEKGAETRTVYLPGQLPWYNFWTGEQNNGGRNVVAKAELNTIPLFVQAGSILPLGPAIQYADQRSSEPMEIRIYPGADGHFELYDDEGDGYGYQKGKYATIGLRWNDTKHVLSIGKRQGKFPGMPQRISFKAVCGAGGKSEQSTVITYSGAGRTIPMSGCQ
jgi:alpha-D-xyloside xylohydrolase